MTPQQLNAMKMALEALKKCRYRSLADEIVDPAITALEEALAEHAMRETQRLGQEIEPDDIASILACRDMLDAQPVPPRTWVGSGDLEDSNAYLTPPQRKPLTDDLYNELLFAVGNKYPNETRHQTALRYILQAEKGDEKAAHGIKGDA